MRHRWGHRKLGRETAHRIALLRNLSTTLIVHGHLSTTLARAKEVRPFVERLVTLGRKSDLAARRRALRILPKRKVVAHLFGEIAPRFETRPGGYTRIFKLGPRKGDGAPMARIEWVDQTDAAEDAPKGESPKSATGASSAEDSLK